MPTPATAGRGTLVVKYGGNAMTDASLQHAFLKDVAALAAEGWRLVVVHGGGPQIDAMLGRLGLDGRFVNGLRVTDETTMAVVQLVLAGAVGPDLVAGLQRAGARAFGVSGVDGGLLGARKRWGEGPNGRPLDLGRVGEVVRVDTDVLATLLDAGYLPVVAPFALAEDGAPCNVNADFAAAAIARALGADALLMLTNTAGVLDRDGVVLAELDGEAVASLIAAGTIGGGMLPKVEAALATARQGVGYVRIVDGRVAGALTAAVREGRGGTAIRA
ncbi:acetylglutamate kinase [Crenobacter caeni]|uniref:Acetylglutamate kinase n=1 Tax=Crenobacter caeni TaxID=2705474 RepID=A0A6B2KTQ4_9NEIS|nr:acetylglutamate kinase [Crenobacter caeni]NDV13612.1 acetylglutamate kinase [Crenobacter caeni]